MPKFVKLSTVPADVLVHSFLKAAKNNSIDACVIYTERADGKSIHRASTNTANGIARAAATIKFKDGAVEFCAATLYKMSSLLRPVPWWKRWLKRAPAELPAVGSFADLDSATQENYRKIAAALIAAASEHGVHSPD